MNIALDMMGGDYAPVEAVKGALAYLKDAPAGFRLQLIGDGPQLETLLKGEYASGLQNAEIVHAPELIGMHEPPTRALKEKPNSSIAVGFGMLARGKSDAFISAGNTGAMLVGALYTIKAVEGVLRPTISTLVPKDNGRTGLLLDVGLNADCKPEHLNQFAVLGSMYAQHVLGIASPRVGLINIGEEEGKGNLLAQAAYTLLAKNESIRFIGNIEGRDIFKDRADVMVCDGFTGNIVLKLAESFYDITTQKGIRHEYLEQFNFENYGGTPVLGVAKPVIIGHGISHAKAFTNMIRLAGKMLEAGLMEKMKKAFEPSMDQ